METGTADPRQLAHPLNTHDAENRLITVNGGASNGGTTYIYDAEGRRITKSGSHAAEYTYDAEGNMITELSSNGSWNRSDLIAAGRLWASIDYNTTVFHTVDWLGTRRVETDNCGNPITGYRNYPFGDNQTTLSLGSPCQTPSYDTERHFTGKERDAESGLDNFGARYYGSSMGRFISADPFTVTPGRVVDPQQLNLYAYVRNNPLKHIDPTGMLIDAAACKQDMKHCGNDWQKVQDIANQQDKNGNYLHPELHNELTTLQNDSRTFVIENSKLDAGTAGQFTITNFSADGKDFTRATLQLDFKQIKGISGVTGADLVPGFNKYQGLLDSPIYRLAVMKVLMACSRSRIRVRLSESSKS